MVLVLAALAIGGFFVARLVTGGSARTEAEQPQPRLEEAIAVRQTVAARGERFVGELLGIYIAPSLDQMPAELQEEYKRLIAGGCVAVPLDQAKDLQFPRQLVMPEGYQLEDGYPQATACSGTASGLTWQYTVPGAQGIPASVLVGRGVSRWDEPGDYAGVGASSVSIEVIGGRKAIVVRPATDDGLAQTSEVIFPEPFGMTFVHAFNLSAADLLAAAEAVAAASQ